MACSREDDRVGAAFEGLGAADPVFTANVDVKSAGVLFGLPSLLLNGLLKYCDEYLHLPKGYYGLQSLLMVLAFVAILRIKSIKGVRYCDTGELGRLVGLDRIPEVKTLREKIEYISGQGNIQKWGKELAKSWMEEDPEVAGTLYIDGHVYHGRQTSLPKRYVSREKLCLSRVTDYWVNDALGEPFFVVTRAVTAGLLSVLREEIVPRLLEDIPRQASQEQLNADRLVFRFGMVFDREGYSPAFFKEMWDKRVAYYTYRKCVREEWSELEFEEEQVIFPNGEVGKMKLAEGGGVF